MGAPVSSPGLSADVDLETLLGQLDLETKVRLISGAGAWTTQAAPEIGLGGIALSDGPIGVRGGSENDWAASAALPCGSAMAATWDEDLLRRVGDALAAEAVRKGVDVLLGPTINLHRSPLAGRNFECFSEDPLLSGRLATAYVRGLQEHGVGACPKHYVANDAETDRMTVDNRVDERTLHELYLAPFEAVVQDADPWMIMAAYNGVNGAPMTENDLLASPLKGQWDYRRGRRFGLGCPVQRRAGGARRHRSRHAGSGREVGRGAGRCCARGSGGRGGHRREGAPAVAVGFPHRAARRRQHLDRACESRAPRTLPRSPGRRHPPPRCSSAMTASCR